MKLRVEVVWALPGRQHAVGVELEEGSSAAQAVAAAGIDARFAALGRHGEKIKPGTLLRDGDRVEILRSLAQDPKEARRKRARKPWRRDDSV